MSIVIEGESPVLLAIIAAFNAEQEARTIAYDKAFWREICQQTPLTPPPRERVVCDDK